APWRLPALNGPPRGPALVNGQRELQAQTVIAAELFALCTERHAQIGAVPELLADHELLLYGRSLRSHALIASTHRTPPPHGDAGGDHIARLAGIRCKAGVVAEVGKAPTALLGQPRKLDVFDQAHVVSYPIPPSVLQIARRFCHTHPPCAPGSRDHAA